MRKTMLMAGALGLALAAAPVAAKPAASVYQACLDNSGGVDPVMKRCGAGEIARQDKMLDAAYRKLRRALTPKLKASLDKGERAFLAYRAAQCGFAYDQGSPGTIAGLLYQSCVIDLTAGRIKTLREAQDNVGRWNN